MRRARRAFFVSHSFLQLYSCLNFTERQSSHTQGGCCSGRERAGGVELIRVGVARANSFDENSLLSEVI